MIYHNKNVLKSPGNISGTFLNFFFLLIIVFFCFFRKRIFFTIKYGGSLASKFSDSLATPSIELLGILSEDLEEGGILFDILGELELEDTDEEKIETLLERPFMNEFWRNDLNLMKANGFKFDVEKLFNINRDFLFIYIYLYMEK